MQINQLSTVDKVSAGDLAVIFSTQNGDARAAAMSVLLAYFQSQLTASGSMATQYSAPNASGFNAQIAPLADGGNIFLLLTPVAGYAAGTITLPTVTACKDGQEVLVTCTQAVTTLTVAGNGATAVNGAPTSLSANGFFRLRFDGVFKSWYRVG